MGRFMFSSKCSRKRIRILYFKANVNRFGSFVFVFDFRFSQRRTAVYAPVDGLLPLIEIAVAQDFSERADFLGLGPEIHGEIRIIPIAQDAEADEISFLA